MARINEGKTEVIYFVRTWIGRGSFAMNGRYMQFVVEVKYFGVVIGITLCVITGKINRTGSQMRDFS
jgi:hypothetical protein